MELTQQNATPLEINKKRNLKQLTEGIHEEDSEITLIPTKKCKKKNIKTKFLSEHTHWEHQAY